MLNVFSFIEWNIEWSSSYFGCTSFRFSNTKNKQSMNEQFLFWFLGNVFIYQTIFRLDVRTFIMFLCYCYYFYCYKIVIYCLESERWAPSTFPKHISFQMFALKFIVFGIRGRSVVFFFFFWIIIWHINDQYHMDQNSFPFRYYGMLNKCRLKNYM